MSISFALLKRRSAMYKFQNLSTARLLLCPAVIVTVLLSIAASSRPDVIRGQAKSSEERLVKLQEKAHVPGSRTLDVLLAGATREDVAKYAEMQEPLPDDVPGFVGNTEKWTKPPDSVPDFQGNTGKPACDITQGTWTNTLPIGTTVWTFSGGPGTYRAQESGGGNASGTATLSGNHLHVSWHAGWKGTYDWTLSSDCTSGSGEENDDGGGGTPRHMTSTLKHNLTGGVAKPLASPTPNRTYPQIATVVSMKGDVGYRAGEAEWADLSPDTKLTSVDQVHTGPDSAVTLRMRDGSTVELSELSQMAIGTLDAKEGRLKVRILLKVGALQAKVVPQKTLPSDFQVRMPTATTSVRGTVFSVRYDEGTQLGTVEVQEGTVQVTPDNSALPPFMLTAGHRVQVARNHVSPITAFAASTTVAANEGSRNSPWPVLAGNWVGKARADSRWATTSITQDGKHLIFRNEYGMTSAGYFESSSRIKATDWAGGLGATITDDGKTIKWDNGSIWQRSTNQP
jgi:hypothetical protein